MENQDKQNRLFIELFGWAKWNIFLCGVFFLTGWAVGIYKIDVNTYQSVSADEMLSWELSQPQQVTHENQKKR